MPTSPELKYCGLCKERKPVGAFHRDRSRSDGLQSYCKDCRKTIEKNRRRNPVERARSVQLWRQRHPERAAAKGREFRKRRPEIVNAHNAVARALKTGRLTKPESCEACGAGGRLEGHHPDYSKPLDVRWLCVGCHYAEHGKEARLATT
jgi:hypothetical protein